MFWGFDLRTDARDVARQRMDQIRANPWIKSVRYSCTPSRVLVRNKGTISEPNPAMLEGYPKGPSTQIVGFQGPKTIQSMDFGTQNPTIWVLGPSGLIH